MARLYRGNKLITNLNIYKIGGGGESGASLNVAYGTIPPTDTSKIWLECEEPQGVEVQNYLGECAVSEVANYGDIDNPTSNISYFQGGYYSSCYIGNNQIVIVGNCHIRIYDVSTKSYIADYTTMGSSGSYASYYTNVIYKDNVLYFGYDYYLYSFDLATQTTTLLHTFDSKDDIKYIFFSNDTNIDCLIYYSYTDVSRHYRYSLISGSMTSITVNGSSYQFNRIQSSRCVKVNNYIYNFYMYTTTSTNTYTWKYSLLKNSFTTFTSFYNFMTELGWTEYKNSSYVYDGERYVYLIGGYGKYNGTYTYSDLIIKYDVINDTFELLDNKLISAKLSHYSELVDNRIYIFGGSTWTSNNVTYGRPNQIDYFDLKYDLQQNNAIITTNTINTDNNLPLINTDKLKLNSNIASAYKGNSENLAEKVNAYYYDGTTWKGINCEDYATAALSDEETVSE